MGADQVIYFGELFWRIVYCKVVYC